MSEKCFYNSIFLEKLPEDIPIVAANAAGLTSLASIDEEEATTPPAETTATKTHKPFGAANKEKIKETSGKILNLLQKKDKKHRESKGSKSSTKTVAAASIDNGEVKVNREETLTANNELDVGSVSSGISDSKSFTSDMEMIPLNSMASSNNNRNNNIMMMMPTNNPSNSSNATANAINKNLEENNEEEETSDLSDGDAASAKPLIPTNDSNGTEEPSAISV